MIHDPIDFNNVRFKKCGLSTGSGELLSRWDSLATPPECSIKTLSSLLADCWTRDDPRIPTAISLVTDTYRGKVRDDGSPTLTQHIFPTAVEVLKAFSKHSQEVQILAFVCALLHDVLEDSKSISYQDLVDHVGVFCASVVKTLSKLPLDECPGELKRQRRAFRRSEYIKRIEDLEATVAVLPFGDFIKEGIPVEFLKPDFLCKSIRTIKDADLLNNNLASLVRLAQDGKSGNPKKAGYFQKRLHARIKAYDQQPSFIEKWFLYMASEQVAMQLASVYFPPRKIGDAS